MDCFFNHLFLQRWW